ncbi:probable cytochrome P450 6a17 [Photinus pyralis]|uniref:probable cytochrome P450 6a17 n=1 Tax=Photinus pyralis TaxID=7054 RepID=UPI001266F96A|nr:probable cytochrome P450 6a17 [Photinus pyralis]
MSVISSCWCTDITVILATCVLSVIVFFKWRYRYWEVRGVPYVKPSIPFGSMLNPFWPTHSFGELMRLQYEESKRMGRDYVGLYTLWIPAFMPITMDLIKDVMAKDFNYFVDRGFYFNEKDDPLSAHLFFLEGAKWRKLRAKLTPTFTSGKMKMMFRIVLTCGKQLTEAMEQNHNRHVPVDIKDLLSRFGTNVIGSCAFGIDCNGFEDPNSDFRRFAKRAFVRTKWENLTAFFSFANPNLARKLGVCFTPQTVSTFFSNLMKQVVEYRESNKTNRDDFLQILLDLKNNSDDPLTLEELTAQAFLFFIAGLETSSTTMTFCLYELANDQDIQDKVREEIRSVMASHKGEISYEAIREMKYMKQVIDETLRKYPPLPMLNRKCVMDYKVPGTDFLIEKGTSVVIPLYGLHHDPEYFPDPERFDPERFNEENKKKMVPYSYMPFGEGPRLCIGLRFGLMQTGIGLALLLDKFRFSVNEMTRVPFAMDPSNFVLSAIGDIWLNVDKV